MNCDPLFSFSMCLEIEEFQLSNSFSFYTKKNTMLPSNIISRLLTARRSRLHFSSFALTFYIFLCVPLASTGQDVKYGSSNYIKNSYNGGSFLDTCSSSSCTATSRYGVVTDANPDRASVGTGKWIIKSATGKTDGSVVKIGDVVYLKNMYSGGSFLDACSSSSCTATSRYGVVTDANPDRAGLGTGKWTIESATGKTTGSALQARDEVYLKNMYSGGSYLDVCNSSSCTATSRYGVVTDANPDRAGLGTGKWSFQPLLDISGVAFVELNSSADQKLGNFQQSDNTGGWIEYGTDADGKDVVRFAFQEIQRDENSVYLHDKTRQVDIRIDTYLNKIMYSDATNTEPTPLYTILSHYNEYMSNNIAKSVAQDHFSFTCSAPLGSNGCSNPSGDPIAAHVYNPLFKSACNTHDACYRSPWRKAGFFNHTGKQACDNAFLEDMNTICDNANFDSIDFIERIQCKVAAEIYAKAVVLHGSSAFDEGQNDANKKCAIK